MQTLTIDLLFERLEHRGTGAYGLSRVTQLEHALQSAALANQADMPEHMVIAALFHDIGHLVSDNDIDLASDGIDDKHEISSANALNPLFGDSVSEPVRLHVSAKRYLCTREPDYYSKLAEDSVTSLELQGGLMSQSELDKFESLRYFKEGIALRRIDDQAKVSGLAVPELESYRSIAQRVLLTAIE